MTDAERWSRVKALFDATLERPPEERAAFLHERCGDDRPLRAEIESLLDADSVSEARFPGSPLQALSPSALIAIEPALDNGGRVLRPGDRVGPYEVTGFIGAGGMGEVYRAHDAKLQRTVAIKVLPAALFGDRERLARLEREARVLASLNHPHIGAIYGWEENEGLCALVLELIEGPTLADRLAGGPLDIPQALLIAGQVASALETAHEKGIVHRDLKPANVVIASAASVKVVDFGLAKAFSGGAAASNAAPLTRDDGAWVGTAAYMSPEQARAQPVNAATDIWAFGCVLYEMLTGSAPFSRATVADTIAAILEHTPDWSRLPTDTPWAARRLLRRALEKDPKRRWHSAGDVKLEIEDLLNERDAPLPAAENVSTAAGRRLARHAPLRNRRAAVLGGAVGAALMAGIASGVRSPVELAEMRLQIVTPHTWELASFSISPDGRQVVFQATTDGRTLLWLRPLQSELAQPLAGTEDGYFPFWSPDSQSIGFFANYQLKRLDFASGLTRTIAKTPHARGGTWNAAGTILYASSSGPLMQVSADGGPQSEASQLLPGHLNHRFPQFLPDGQRFLFVAVGTSESRGLFVGSLATNSVRRVLETDTTGSFLPSNQVLFARQGALWALPVNADLEAKDDPVLVAGQVMTHPDVGAHKAHSSSASGTIAYRAAAGEQRLVWLDRTGREIGTVGGPDAGQPGYIRLSPDGRTVALRRMSAGNTDVWLSDVKRGIPQRMTFDPALDWAAEFSPDGSRIVFASNRKSGIDDLYARAVAGGSEELLLASAEQKVPLDWSPDGRHILYAVQSVRTGFDLWVLPLFADRKPFPVVETPFEDGDTKYGAAFSPDGRWIAYQSDQSGKYEIYLQPFPGPGRSVQVTTKGGFSPQWRADGREVFFLGANNTLMAATVALDVSTPRIDAPEPLFRMPPDTEFGDYAVSPDGQRILVSRLLTPPSPITVLLNWRPPYQ